ncbi:unnamed protein product [Leptidea sinapis]|uniref:Uncharacterized protein n=1 Tax=Leptidea sinapis TaxID=189913 RepID=A0A5E4Q9A6_9NEOP|nr:unnamed protein product [Leptidea sinapis]
MYWHLVTTATEMKGTVLLLSVVVSCVRGSAVFWPGAIPVSSSFVKTIIPPQVKGFSYSSSQYINAIPATYNVGYQPQLSYQVPQFGIYPSYPGIPSYQPALAPAYYPGAGFVYPSPAVSPILPPSSVAPTAPPSRPPTQANPVQQPAGDEDTTVIESAEFSPGQTQNSQTASQFNQNANYQSYDSRNMPEFSQIPAVPDVPQVPQIPSVPAIPNIPAIAGPPGSGNNLSQYPQLSQPPQQSQFEYNPFQTQNSGLPSSQQNTQNLNDEDTVAVESA